MDGPRGAVARAAVARAGSRGCPTQRPFRAYRRSILSSGIPWSGALSART